MEKRPEKYEDSIYTYNMAGAPLMVIPCADPVTWVAGLSEKGAPKDCPATVWTWGPSGPGNVRGLVHVLGPRPAQVPAANTPYDLMKVMGVLNSNPHIVLAYGIHGMIDRDPALQQALLDGLSVWKQLGNTLALLVPTGTQLTGFLGVYAESLEVPLPDADTLEAIAGNLKRENSLKGEVAGLGKALLGVTAFQAEDGLARLSIRLKRLPTPEEAGTIKAGAINAHPALEYVPPELLPKWEEVEGLGNLKNFMYQTSSSPISKGVMILGPAGTGKTMSAKALAGALGCPLVMFNLSAVFGGLVGQSEAAVRMALAILKRIGPHVLVLDEIEKLIGGAVQSGRSDGGVGERVAKELLLFLQDRPEGIYVVATCNNMEALPPEYTRAERFDAIFFVDLPTVDERKSILALYAKKYGVKVDGVSVETTLDGWTGAEIQSLCRIASMMKTSAKDAVQFVVPISRTMKEKIDGLRDWSVGRCVPASSPTPIMAEAPKVRKLGGMVN